MHKRRLKFKKGQQVELWRADRRSTMKPDDVANPCTVKLVGYSLPTTMPYYVEDSEGWGWWVTGQQLRLVKGAK